MPYTWVVAVEDRESGATRGRGRVNVILTVKQTVLRYSKRRILAPVIVSKIAPRSPRTFCRYCVCLAEFLGLRRRGGGGVQSLAF